MKSGDRNSLPARLESVRLRFEQWRRTRDGYSRIPEPLWTSAVKLAGAYGLCRTARTLGLDYNTLKRRVASANPHGSPGQKPDRQKMVGQEPATAFVELALPAPACSPECILDLENPHGTKMRIRLNGRQNLEVVAAVSRVFFGAAS